MAIISFVDRIIFKNQKNVLAMSSRSTLSATFQAKISVLYLQWTKKTEQTKRFPSPFSFAKEYGDLRASVRG